MTGAYQENIFFEGSSHRKWSWLLGRLLIVAEGCQLSPEYGHKASVKSFCDTAQNIDDSKLKQNFENQRIQR